MVQRGSIVLWRGVRHHVVAVRQGKAWLSGAPWTPCTLIAIRHVMAIPGCYAELAPWDVN